MESPTIPTMEICKIRQEKLPKPPSKDAVIQKKKKHAREWTFKSALFMGTAPVASSTIYESYIEYCEDNGSIPLQLSELEKLWFTILTEQVCQYIWS